MSQELHYTSVPRGLKPGSRGFCTVSQTPHMPVALADRLEALSGYQPVFPPHDPSAPLNPIAFSHLRLTIAGKGVSVLSRIGPAGLDYTGRPNKHAHHVVLEGSERPEGGPAWLLSQPGFMQSAWEGEPREIPAGRVPPHGDHQPGAARAWQTLTGDGGWAGVLAESFLADPRRTAFLVFRPGMDVLSLFVEALALLPAARRWDVDFSTYFTPLPQGVNCAWRAVLEGSAEAKNARRLPNALVLDLCRDLGRADSSVLAHLARTGEPIVQHAAPPTRPLASDRSITRMSEEAAEPDTEKPRRSQASERRSASYELFPDLAKLVSSRGIPTAPKAFEPGHSRFNARWAVALLVSTVLSVSLIAVTFFLSEQSIWKILGSNPDIAAEREHVSERKRSPAAETVNGGPRPDVPEPKTKDNSTAKIQIVEKQPEQLPDLAHGRQRDENKGHKREDRAPAGAMSANQTPGPCENPLFFTLDEPASILKKDTEPLPLYLSDPNFQLDRMELLGGDQTLRCETKSGPPTIVVSVISDASIERRGSVAKPLARFEASAEKTIKFSWAKDQSARDGQEHARRRLRDCVLKLESKTGQIQYCVLRSKPVSPQSPKEFSDRLSVTHTSSATHNRYKWDFSESFKDTSRTTQLLECEISARNGLNGISFEKREDNSWAAHFHNEILLSVKLDGGEILINLQDGKPAKLEERIRAIDGEIYNTQRQLSEYQKGLAELNDRAKAERRTETVRDFMTRIGELRATKEKLVSLRILYDSNINCRIAYEISGLKFVIAIVEKPASSNR
jgi:hypothetical protein